MTTRNLNALFHPSAIAHIGASNRDGSVGRVVAHNLLTGGFAGPIRLVNPHDREVLGAPAFADIGALPEAPDLAVISTPPAQIPTVIGQLGEAGCRAAVVITAGFDAALRQAMLEAARPYVMRIVGPNCLGFMSPASGIDASFVHLHPLKGGLAFLTQSGAIATSIVDWGNGRGVGFSHILSLGDMSDVDFGDLLDYLAADVATAAILIYAEGITHARKFMSAARIASRAKPVIVVKGGRAAAGAKAAASHTGALAGADAVYQAAFRRAGMLQVETLRDLFDAAETLASGVRVDGDRLAIVTNGGGLGVLAADALEREGGRLAKLSPAAMTSLDAALPASWSHNNPIDILGDAHGDRYEKALAALSNEAECDAVLVMNCPTGVAESVEAADATLKMRDALTRTPLLGCWMGEATAAISRRKLSLAGLPNYETPDEAVRAFLRLSEYARNQAALMEAPPAAADRPPERRETARAVIVRALAENRELLTEPEAKAVLAEYGVPIVATASVATPQDAGQAAARIGGVVALKILSRDITHKSDVGGVRLDLEGGDAVEAAAIDMLATVTSRMPNARIDGFTVQAMIRRPLAQELILGAVIDPTFGPCLLVGQGGVSTEVVADRVMGLAPLNHALAMDMIRRTRIERLLAGFRDRPPADHAAVAHALEAISDMVVELPEIAELDINPLLADADGVIALDARIVVRPPADLGDARLSIRPYPRELASEMQVGGQTYRFRPIRPTDARLLLDMAARTTAEDLRLRFHAAVSPTSEEAAVRLSQIDYDREMVFLAIDPEGAVAGVSRLAFDPNFETAELAVIVRTDAQHHGLGAALVKAALEYARTRGARSVWGDVMPENDAMRGLAHALGGKLDFQSGPPMLVRIEFALDPAA